MAPKSAAAVMDLMTTSSTPDVKKLSTSSSSALPAMREKGESALLCHFMILLLAPQGKN